MIKIKQTKEFSKWLQKLTLKEQAKIYSRLEKIESFGYFGDAKHIGDGLVESRWKNGWRVYFIKEDKSLIILLVGGNKNAQKNDIEKARILIKRYTN